METNNTPQPIIKQIREYLETRFKLLKYEVIEEGSSILSSLITDLIMVIVFLFGFLFFSVTLALFLGKILGYNWAGFGTVTLLYLLIAIVAKSFKIGIENALIKVFVKKLFKRKNNG